MRTRAEIEAEAAGILAGWRERRERTLDEELGRLQLELLLDVRELLAAR